MRNRADVVRATQYLTLARVFDSICWRELQDRANPCVNWLNLDPLDRREYAETRCNVELMMPRNSKRYQTIYGYMCQYFDKKWLSHDFFIKLVARALMYDNYSDFKSCVRFSQVYRAMLSSQAPKPVVQKSAIPTKPATTTP